MKQCNENGLNKPLITTKQHLKLIEMSAKKRRMAAMLVLIMIMA